MLPVSRNVRKKNHAKVTNIHALWRKKENVWSNKKKSICKVFDAVLGFRQSLWQGYLILVGSSVGSSSHRRKLWLVVSTYTVNIHSEEEKMALPVPLYLRHCGPWHFCSVLMSVTHLLKVSSPPYTLPTPMLDKLYQCVCRKHWCSVYIDNSEKVHCSQSLVYLLSNLLNVKITNFGLNW